MIDRVESTDVKPQFFGKIRCHELRHYLLLAAFQNAQHKGIMGMWEGERKARNERALEDKNGEFQRRARGDEGKGHGLSNHRVTNLHRFGVSAALHDVSLQALRNSE